MSAGSRAGRPSASGSPTSLPAQHRRRKPELLLEAHLAKLTALLELGDPAFAAHLDAFATLAERLGIPRYVYLARSRRATQAALTGPLAVADELIEAAAAYGTSVGEPDVWSVQASQLVGLASIRQDWTRLSAMAAARGAALTPPEFSVYQRAWLLVEAGEVEAAAAIVRSIPPLPSHYRWRHTALLTMDAELAVAVHDRDRCAAVYAALLPRREEFAVVAAAVFSTGPVVLQLGLLAAELGRPEDAAAHLAEAVERCERLGATLWPTAPAPYSAGIVLPRARTGGGRGCRVRSRRACLDAYLRWAHSAAARCQGPA